MSIIERKNLKPTKVVEIMVGDLTVPVETGIELSRLALIGKDIFTELLKDAERDKETGKYIVPPQALAWFKELAKLYKDIHELTKGVQEKVMVKQMDIVSAVYKQAVKNKTPEEIVKIIKDLENAKRDK